MPRKKKKPHRAVHRNVTREQVEILNHLLNNVPYQLQHMHPRKGMFGEILPIAFGTTPEGDVLVRLDRVPGFGGTAYTQALLDAFPEFPICLDMGLKGWTPESHPRVVLAPILQEVEIEIISQ